MRTPEIHSQSSIWVVSLYCSPSRNASCHLSKIRHTMGLIYQRDAKGFIPKSVARSSGIYGNLASYPTRAPETLNVCLRNILMRSLIDWRTRRMHTNHAVEFSKKINK